MTTLTKIIALAVLSLLMLSCNFDVNFGPGVTGNRNVITKNRTLEGDFKTIEVSRGLDVYLTQSDNESITVEADENLHEIIVTTVEEGVLKIYADENIASSESQKVMVNFKHISKITSTSGSDVYGTNVITEDELELKTTSGSDMELEVNANTITCKATSGSDLKISGKTKKLNAEATSGSDIKAGDLIALSSKVKATSGADITVNTSEELIAKATSGGDIKYYGNPEKVEKNDSASGNIKKQ